MGAATQIAERLAPVHAILTALEHELYQKANADHDPADWQNWADVNAALMATRSVVARERRGAGFRPAEEATP